jgi:prepilin-type N-terminal cleavage/methylation domain-containing protein
MKSFAKKYSATTAGLTLLESMIGLAIFAIVIWAAMANYASASGSHNASQIAVEIQALRTSVRELYAGQPSYGTSEIITQIIASNRTPRTLTVNNGTITNSFGAAVQVIGNEGTFSLEYPALPKGLCLKTLTGPAANGWDTVKVQATSSPLPLSVSQAQGLCTGSVNVVIFTGT